MLDKLHELLAQMPPVATVIISIACMLFFGFAMTRLTKLMRLPNVTAYILAGILIGPYCLDLIPSNVVQGMDFLSDIALALISFTTGEFFKVSILKKNAPAPALAEGESGAEEVLADAEEAFNGETAPAEGADAELTEPENGDAEPQTTDTEDETNGKAD